MKTHNHSSIFLSTTMMNLSFLPIFVWVRLALVQSQCLAELALNRMTWNVATHFVMVDVDIYIGNHYLVLTDSPVLVKNNNQPLLSHTCRRWILPADTQRIDFLPAQFCFMLTRPAAHPQQNVPCGVGQEAGCFLSRCPCSTGMFVLNVALVSRHAGRCIRVRNDGN